MLEPLRPRSPRPELKLTESTARHGLLRCSYPGIDYSLNPYVGCAHACTFCYVPDLRHLDRAAWGTTVAAKRNLPAILARDVRRLPPGLVAISTATDPYQFAEGQFGITRRCLEILARSDWRTFVLTRSPLVLRDVDVLRRFSRVTVGLSLPTLDDRARAALEPHAPTVGARLQALRRLSDAGIDTTVSFAPAYPPTGGQTAGTIAATLADAGVRRVWGDPLRMVRGARSAMLDAIRAAGFPQLATIADRPGMDAFLTDLRRECLARGLAWARGDELARRRHGPAGGPGGRAAPA